jgi:hypothetical protein
MTVRPIVVCSIGEIVAERLRREHEPADVRGPEPRQPIEAGQDVQQRAPRRAHYPRRLKNAQPGSLLGRRAQGVDGGTACGARDLGDRNHVPLPEVASHAGFVSVNGHHGKSAW